MRLLLPAAVALLLAACTSGPSNLPSGPALPQRVSTHASPDGTGWMDISAKKVDLLYISESNGQVTVYTYWQKTLVGQLTGFGRPMGECVDRHNDVFITDSSAQRIVEYAHAGKTPLKTIDDAPYAPYACSVDLATGTLAVANEAGNGTTGNIAVYVNATAKPALYSDPSIPNFEDCAYDNQGNLLASNGQAGSRISSFAWLPKDGKKLIPVAFPGPRSSWTWEDITGIQWDGRYWVLDDYGLYRVAMNNGQGYYVGETSFQGDYAGTLGPFWIYSVSPKKQGTQAVGVYDSDEYADVQYWNYPAGGEAVASISYNLSGPVAVTVSLGKIHE